MNLEDLLDEYGLHQDVWSESRPRFGKEGQLEVVGWSGRAQSNKFYILKCSKCSEDGDLFLHGYFKSTKGSLVKGRVPCGCTFNPKWTKEQYDILCVRRAEELGYMFLGFVGDWRGAYTKINMVCDRHGAWATGNINNLISSSTGCPVCRNDTLIGTKVKPDEIMIDTFFKSGYFHPCTTFYRSDRKNSQGYKSYWHVDCPECGERGEASSGNLQKGQRPCACSTQRQQQTYINWIVDTHNLAVGIKFGIARDSSVRIKSQNRYSVYEVVNHSVYTFPDVSSCKAAERECKQTLECGVLSKEEMPDGYTETTSVLNLGRIKRIYEKHGGILND